MQVIEEAVARSCLGLVWISALCDPHTTGGWIPIRTVGCREVPEFVVGQKSRANHNRGASCAPRILHLRNLRMVRRQNDAVSVQREALVCAPRDQSAQLLRGRIL